MGNSTTPQPGNSQGGTPSMPSTPGNKQSTAESAENFVLVDSEQGLDIGDDLFSIGEVRQTGSTNQESKNWLTAYPCGIAMFRRRWLVNVLSTSSNSSCIKGSGFGNELGFSEARNIVFRKRKWACAGKGPASPHQ